MCVHVNAEDVYGTTASCRISHVRVWSRVFGHVFKIVPVHGKDFLSTRRISFYIEEVQLIESVDIQCHEHTYMCTCTCACTMYIHMMLKVHVHGIIVYSIPAR